MIEENGRESDAASLERQSLSTADIAGHHEDPKNTAALVRESDRQGKSSREDSAEPLFPPQETQELRDHWGSIQAGFVDEPRKAVEDADSLVATAMKRLAEIFASERDRLESQWDRGDDVSTEDLRIALRRYRSFFDRLLSM